MPSNPSRRDALRLGGGVLTLLAGCTTDSNRQTDPATTTGTTMTDSKATTTTSDGTTTAATDATVTNVETTPALLVMNSPDSTGTYGERDEQFVIVTVESDGSLPDRDEFTLEADGTSYVQPSVRDRWVQGDGYSVVPDNHLSFSVPKPLDATGVSLRWKDDTYWIGKTALRTLRRPPTDFSVEASAPKPVTESDDVTLTLTVENTGEVAGTFVGALNRSGPNVAYTPVTAVSFEIEAGESTTWSHSYETDDYVAEDELTMTYHLDWRDGSRSRTIRIESDSEQN
ncbi:hypothetical protein [Haladaptatus sp. DYF46]|uniref:hypothetical protein n=1 Tax=Haladaptatus sp. DYF46 TaxID=2886041 RepID=UPI001E48F81B|nr:hypothetical protein [Haladaptatus sp. DYF46]